MKSTMTELLQRFQGRTLIPLRSFLLPEDHPIITKCYRDLRDQGKATKDVKNKDKHDRDFKNMGYKDAGVWRPS